MKNKFTESEWDALLDMPGNFFLIVAGADNDFDPHEFHAFFDTRDGKSTHSQLARNLFREILDTPERVRSNYQGDSSPQDEIFAADRILKAKLSEEDRLEFIDWLVSMSLRVAYACGDKKQQDMEEDNFSEVERGALAELCVALRYPRAHFHEIWQKFRADR